MPVHAHSSHGDIENLESSNVAAPEPGGVDALAGAAIEDDAASTVAISIELDFNAYADNVPATRHARRVVSNTDPSVQDFADQALELAALRAELKRLTRDYEVLQLALRSRDMRLQKLHDELVQVRIKSSDGTHQSSADRSHVLAGNDAARDNDDSVERIEVGSGRETNFPDEAPGAADLSATQELPSPHALDSATVDDVSAATQQSTAPPIVPARQLIPVHHDGEPIFLSRDIMTIGRTPQNDIRIPSRAVSRDHARLLIGPRSVTIVDMSSSNGCFVNDEPVKKQQLRNGDVLRIGDHSYRFTC